MIKSITTNKKKALLSGGIIFAVLLLLGSIIYAHFQQSDKPIHIQAGETSFDWNKNPSEIKDLNEVANIIAKVKYTGNSRSYKLEGSAVIRTAYAVDILEVLEGSIPDKRIEIIGWGGKITLKEYIRNCSDEELAQDADILDMSEKAISASTYEDTDYLGIDFHKNDEAIVFLQNDQTTKGKYEIAFGGLGLFEKNNENGEYLNRENKLDARLNEKTIMTLLQSIRRASARTLTE